VRHRVVGPCFGRRRVGLAGLAEWKVLRRERALHPGPPRRRRDIVLPIAFAAAIYGVIGGAFYLGWRHGGLNSGAFTAAAAALILVLGAIPFAIRAALVSRQKNQRPG
jgi:hypothetical protein